MDAIKEIKLDDADWGEIRLVMAIPRPGNPWGTFAPLKGTVWEKVIKVVSGEAMSDALHGLATPLIRELRKKPLDTLKAIPLAKRRCGMSLDKSCLAACEDCMPGTRRLPICYEPPEDDPVVRTIAAEVGKWLDQGLYVVVVEGDEFSL